MRNLYGLGLSVTAALVAPALAETGTWRLHADHVMGTSLDIAVVAKRPVAAALAIDAARSEIARLDPILSAWRSDSELMRLNAATSFQASPDLFAVISACESWRRKTRNAYSARIGGLLEICSQGRNDALAARIETALVYIDAPSRTIIRPDDVVFAIDGLAKGYVIDRALAGARCVPGIDGMMIDIGGDLACWGVAPDGNEWRIGLVEPANPADNTLPASFLRLRDKAAATSGRSSRQQVTLSPRTGQRAGHVAYATAVADSAANADALATAFMVMEPGESLRLADSLPGVAARILTADGEEALSSRWQDYCATSPGHILPAADAATSTPWPAGYALDVEYNVPKVETGTYHNPYVAIWITDQNRALVRTLLVLGKEGRYWEENYVYWRRFGRLDTKLVETVSRPTRAPGRYNLTWDGRDDAGRKVGQGKYILNIEAARERGGHSVQRIELELGADGVTAETKPEGEIGKVRAVFGRSL